MITEEDFLAHFGVKGMRWGHRKREESGGNEGNSNAPTVSSSKRGRIVGENNRIKSGKETSTIRSNGDGLTHGKHPSQEHLRFAADMMQAKYGVKKDVDLNPKTPKTPEELAAIRRRNVKIGMAVVATGLVAYGGYRAVSSYNSPINVARREAGYLNSKLYDQAVGGGRAKLKSVESPESIKRFGAIMDRFGDMTVVEGCVSDDVSAERVIKKTPGFSVKSGQTIYRMSASEDFSLGKDYAFMNIRESDHRRYKALYSATVGGNLGQTRGIYSHTLEAQSEIRVASGKDVLEASKAVSKKLSSFRNSDLAMTSASINAAKSPHTAAYIDVQAIIKGESYNDRPGTKALVEELKKRGFHGMPDFGDNGRSTNSAVILFDPKTLVKSKVSEKMTPEKVIEAIMTSNPNPFDD